MASTAFRISRVGHVVLRVRDVDESLAFYTGLLGLREVGRGDFGEGLMVFLSTGDNHHDLALVQGEADAPRGSIGLHHFAFKIGDSWDELVAAKADLDARGVAVHAAFDFRVSKPLIVSDRRQLFPQTCYDERSITTCCSRGGDAVNTCVPGSSWSGLVAGSRRRRTACGHWA